ncbi:MAG: two-component sensor histidine kinase, partial [Leptolyngbyaceae cyanobacterium CAN_BIN12]|nr:two-component sensor histidine kinase [Leptolyngbyaceae cyanobacterium CAN_BIN12]
MHDNKPFNQSRRRLAGSYAVVMGIILSLCGLTAYQMLAYAHWQAIAQELESVSGTLHDSLESKLMQPGQLSVAVEQALPGLCIIGKNCTNQPSDRHILGIVRQGDYYIRFLDQSGRVVAVLGQPPKG